MIVLPLFMVGSVHCSKPAHVFLAYHITFWFNFFVQISEPKGTTSGNDEEATGNHSGIWTSSRSPWLDELSLKWLLLAWE